MYWVFSVMGLKDTIGILGSFCYAIVGVSVCGFVKCSGSVCVC